VGGEQAKRAAQHHRRIHIEARKGFVQDEQFGIVDQSRHEQDLLPHALGVGGYGGIAVLPKADQAQQFIHSWLEHFTRDTRRRPESCRYSRPLSCG
jgi:hypothetical protein